MLLDAGEWQLQYQRQLVAYCWLFERFFSQTTRGAWSEIYIVQDRRLVELPLECKLRHFDSVTGPPAWSYIPRWDCRLLKQFRPNRCDWWRWNPASTAVVVLVWGGSKGASPSPSRYRSPVSWKSASSAVLHLVLVSRKHSALP